MLVTFNSKGQNGNPIANFSEEMSVEEFAHRYATAMMENSELDPEATQRFSSRGKAFARMFGLDHRLFLERDLDGQGGSVTFSPYEVQATNHGNGTLVEVLIPISGVVLYFRRTGNSLLRIPYAKGCHVETGEGGLTAKTTLGNYRATSPEFPWIAFCPEKFERVTGLGRVLTALPTNPLTGLLESRDGAVRTLANQLTVELRKLRGEWVADIVDSF